MAAGLQCCGPQMGRRWAGYGVQRGGHACPRAALLDQQICVCAATGKQSLMSGSCRRPPAGDEGGSSDDDMADGEEGEEGGQQAGNGGGSARRRRGKATEGFKEQVVEVLQRHDFLERRAAKMSQDDFLHLLAVFNQAGIHFV